MRLNINDGFNMKDSIKTIGEVTIEEYDADGKLLFTETGKNTITVGGATYVMEKIFNLPKDISTGSRFLFNGKRIITDDLPYAYNLGSYYGSSEATNITKSNIKDERIFGIVIGNTGEYGGNVVDPSFKDLALTNLVPFKVYAKDGETDPNADTKADDEGTYFMNSNVTYRQNGEEFIYPASFAKSFMIDPSIKTEWADGAGPVRATSTDNGNSPELNAYTGVPIVTYTSAKIKISASDVRRHFKLLNNNTSDISNCFINQLGLVAGYPIVVDGKVTDYADVKLVTSYNFKSRDLSNTENTILITYKLYCL